MIGHELTGGFGIDHARTLSIILPAIMKVKRNNKHEKLLQFAERVWHLTDVDDELKIDKAIALTEDFFKRMDVPTRLSDVGLNESNVDGILEKLEQHSMVELGEHSDITLAVSRKILTLAL